MNHHAGHAGHAGNVGLHQLPRRRVPGCQCTRNHHTSRLGTGPQRPSLSGIATPCTCPNTQLAAQLGHICTARQLKAWSLRCAGCAEHVGEAVPRLLVNKEVVGTSAFAGDQGFDFQQGSRDVLFQRDCDEGITALCRLLGWEAELAELVHESGFQPRNGLQGGLL